MKKGKHVYVDGYNDLPDGRRIWLIQAADDAGWNWDDFLPHKLSDGHRGWGGEEWIRSSSSRKRIRDEFKPGDVAVCYQATPEKAVVGLARVASKGFAIRRGKRTPGTSRFDFNWGCWVEPLSLHDIKTDPVLRNTEKARVGQGTIFRVSAKEFERILMMTAPVGESIATVQKALGINWPESSEPTPNDAEYERRVRTLVAGGPIAAPPGIRRPRAVVRSNVTSFVRDPKVRGWVLQHANGRCEMCDKDAPFRDEGGAMFLETHHVRPLAAKGSDRTQNVVAVCPNCHRHLHLGLDAAEQKAKLLARIPRLVAE